jgi:hypothetical protein
MRIRVLTEAGLHHGPAGLCAWGPGEHDFPDNPLYLGWFNGMVQRGLCEIIPEPEPEAVAASEPEPAPEPKPVLEPKLEPKPATKRGGSRKK